MNAAAAPSRIGVLEPMPGVVYPNPADLARYVAAGALTDETLVDGFRSACERYPQHIALEALDARITYAELDSSSTRLAAALLDRGLKPLDSAIFQLGDSEQLVIAFLACLKAGIIPICTLAAHREHEIGYLAELAGARLHVVQGDNPKFDDIEFARRMQQQVPSLGLVLQARGKPASGVLHLDTLIAETSAERARKRLEAIRLDPFQVAVFQLSGGTTGVPKIIPRFHNEYLYNMRCVARRLEYGPDDVLFIPQPMVHNLNMGCCFGPFLMTGGTVTVARETTPDALIGLIRKTRPTWLVLGGPIIAKLDAAIKDGTIDLSNARGIITAGGGRKLNELTGVRVHQIYGITEGVIMLSHRDDGDDALYTTNGRTVSELDQVRIVTPGTETDVAPGEIGEPIFKGPYTIHGYYKAEQRNRQIFTSDGFYRPQDLMRERRIDGQAFYVFCGRLKDLVNRAGEKINCEEVEMVVATHPSVAAVAAVGYPDPVYDERLCVVLILREGFEAPSIEQLGQFLRDYGMAKYKWPERIEIVASFPLTASGKVSKPKLQEMVTGNLN